MIQTEVYKNLSIDVKKISGPLFGMHLPDKHEKASL